MKPVKLVRLTLTGLLGLGLLFGSFYTISPGNRGIIVTMGKVDPTVKGEGLGFKLPFLSGVEEVSVRQQTNGFESETFSSDLQQVSIKIKVLYRVPESSVATIFQQYSG